MANIDRPNGFTFVSSMLGHGELWKGLRVGSGAAITKGDAIIISATVPQVQIAVANSPKLYGISAQDLATSTAIQPIWFYPSLYWNVFEGQCSGTFATTMVSTSCDIEGTTGIMEVNENAVVEDVINIIGYSPNTEVGLNARVYFYVIRSAVMAFLADK